MHIIICWGGMLWSLYEILFLFHRFSPGILVRSGRCQTVRAICCFGHENYFVHYFNSWSSHHGKDVLTTKDCNKIRLCDCERRAESQNDSGSANSMWLSFRQFARLDGVCTFVTISMRQWQRRLHLLCHWHWLRNQSHELYGSSSVVLFRPNKGTNEWSTLSAKSLKTEAFTFGNTWIGAWIWRSSREREIVCSKRINSLWDVWRCSGNDER
jgi:hypothetical protein